MSEFVPQQRTRYAEDTDLLCVEVSALGATAVTAPSVAVLPTRPVLPLLCGSSGCGWQSPPLAGTDTTQEEFLRSLLLKTDAYRPRQESLACMENEDFLAMRKAVVNWFANVSVSYKFTNETVVAALSNFDRYVAVTLEPVTNYLLLQLAAYVALLVASKMSELAPLRMKSLANLTGRMFTPLQVQKCELDMISKLHFRLAPPSADETLHCLATLVYNIWPANIPLADILSTASCYLKKARARTCWFRHSPYTLAVAALATAFNSLGLGQRKHRLLRECNARARKVTGRGVDFHGVAACAAAMSGDGRTAAVAAAAARAVRGGTESPVCNKFGKDGWGSPTGVAQGAELLQEVAFSAVGEGCLPLLQDLSPATSMRAPTIASPQTFNTRVTSGGTRVTMAAVPIATRAGASRGGRELSVGRGVGTGDGGALCGVDTSGGSRLPRHGQKRALHQSYGSCFVPCARRTCVEGVERRVRGCTGAGVRQDACASDHGHVTTDDESQPCGEAAHGDGDSSDSNSCTSSEDS